eukprot:4707668-Heterocapsa_arctica.AAC.1
MASSTNDAVLSLAPTRPRHGQHTARPVTLLGARVSAPVTHLFLHAGERSQTTSASVEDLSARVR